MPIKLDPRPARELTSREAAKLIGGMLGGVANLCPPETLFAALDFYTSEQYQAGHENIFRAMWEKSVRDGHVIPQQENP